LNPPLEAARYFLSEGETLRVVPFGTGNVNDTFLLTTKAGEQLVLQRVNPAVFPDPQQVQDNMRIVTGHLRQGIENTPRLREIYTPLVLLDGKEGDTYHDQEGGIWRLVNHVSGRNQETISSPFQAEELGRCLGIFHRLLADLDPGQLVDTLPGFHHTPACLEAYERTRAGHDRPFDPEEDRCHRFIEDRRGLATRIVDAVGLSRGIIHGDPKVANFIFDAENGRVVSLIDLDTVRPGLLLHDIGDALRSCCNPLGETPETPSRTVFDAGLFRTWLNGYREEAGLLLTVGDKTHIVEAVRVIAFELGLRFLTDHLQGNRYFKVRYPEHNLFRAGVQFHLVRSMEMQQETLESIARECMA